MQVRPHKQNLLVQQGDIACNVDALTRSSEVLPDLLSLADLCQRLDQAGADLVLDNVESLLASICLTDAERRAFVRFDQHTYRRNLVCRRAHYELLVLCWRPGQSSPVHDHRGSRCALTILTGEAIEVRYKRDAADRLRAISYQPLPTGAVVSSVDSDLHVVANWKRPDCDLITLHVYSPPLRDMRIYPDAEVVPAPLESLRHLDPPPPRCRRFDCVSAVCRAEVRHDR